MGAVIKASNGRSKGATGGLENYLKQEQKTEKDLMYGKDCDVDNFAKEFQATKELYNKTDGRQHIHIIQSWRAGEVDAQTAHEIGQEFLKHEKFNGFQAVCITHTDRDHVHNHFVINSVNLENGLKYHQTQREYELLKEHSREINLQRGIEPEQKILQPGDVRVYENKYKYKAIQDHFEGKKDSYLINTAIAVDKAMETATNKREFIQEMEQQGYKVNWTDNRKYITFEDPEGHKVRNSNLEKTFSNEKYSKEGLTHELERPKEREQETIREPEYRINVDWGAIENTLRAEKDRLPKPSVDGVTGKIQQQVRDIEDRTHRATESTEELNRRAKQESGEHEYENPVLGGSTQTGDDEPKNSIGDKQREVDNTAKDRDNEIAEQRRKALEQIERDRIESEERKRTFKRDDYNERTR